MKYEGILSRVVTLRVINPGVIISKVNNSVVIILRGVVIITK